jgi:hypothetical protein
MLALAPLIVSTTAFATAPAVVLYDREGFRGAAFSIALGPHPGLSFDDRAASLRVGPSTVLTAYELPDFAGRALRIVGERSLDHMPTQQDGGRTWPWKQKISSLIACRSDDPDCLRPLLHQRPHFKGPSHTVADPPVDPDVSAASVQVPLGWRLQTFSEAGFRGTPQTFDGPCDVPDAGSVRSYRAERL